MENRIILSKIVFDKLSKHLIEFSSIQNTLLNDNELIPVSERKDYQEIFGQYCQHIQRLLKEAHINDSNDNSLPCVTLGSVVELENLENKRTNKIMVTIPSFIKPPDTKKRIAQTSYNSPVGKALFLKKPGDTVEVNAPGGTFQYRIKTIDLFIS